MKTNDELTCIVCDQCGLQVENQAFFEILSDDGEQLGVWYGTPTNWLTFVDEHGYVVYACTKDCAVLLSKKVLPRPSVKELLSTSSDRQQIVAQD